jgi:myo-inositol-1(or 4)-monophosphatase
MDDIMRVAVAAARQGAAVLLSRFGRIGKVEKKGVVDLVTEADTASEAAVIEVIRSVFPGHAVLAEESGSSGGGGDECWVIDPLDGTTNFAHGVTLFAVSIAYVRRGAPVAGVVLNPASGELFTAAAGGGAWCNGKPMRVSPTTDMVDSLLVTGFPYNVREILPEAVRRFTRCLGASQGVRRLGSAALDLCWVADGRFEAFWEQNLQPWDTAAGWLMVSEAGGRVTDFSNGAYGLEAAEILASNGRIHEEMLTLLQDEEKNP